MYRIIYWMDGSQVGSTPWGSDLDAAKTHARYYRKVRGASLAEVIDIETQAVVAAYTETDDADRT